MIRHRRLFLLLSVAVAPACSTSAVASMDSCDKPANEIVAENCQAGDPPAESS
jgi:hypothetical protein